MPEKPHQDECRAGWPTVLPDDDGIRPAGPSDACFYCRQKVGTPHGRECVTVTKTVKVRYTFEVELEVPHFWDGGMVEFHRNESSWCADNAIGDLEEYVERLRGEEGDGGCLCHGFECEYLGEADSTPRGHVRKSASI